MHTYDELRASQHDMINRLYEFDSGLVVADMGTGKTVSTLTAIKELQDAGEIGRVLVLAPYRVASGVWHTEAANWTHLAGLTVEHALGTERQRDRVFQGSARVVVMNYENLQWLCERPRLLCGFDGLVFDEVSRMKGGHTSRRFKALKKHLPQFKWRVGLTGTPAPNGLMDLWATSYVIDSGAALGRSVSAFRQKYFTPFQRPAFIEWVPQPDAEARIYKALEASGFVMPPQDLVDEPVTVTHPVKPSVEARIVAAKLRKTYVDPAGNPVTNKAVLAGKLHQLAQGFLYCEDDKGGQHYLYDRIKLGKCTELVESLNGNPVIIAYKFRVDLEQLQFQFPNAPNLGSGTSAAAGEQIIEQWNRGELPVLLLHPASAGHGLNLQYGGHHMIWYGLTWSSEEYRQAIKRIARPGQTCQTYVHLLIAEGTIDERILLALESKIGTEQDLIAALLEQQESATCTGEKI